LKIESEQQKCQKIGDFWRFLVKSNHKKIKKACETLFFRDESLFKDATLGNRDSFDPFGSKSKTQHRLVTFGGDFSPRCFFLKMLKLH
jgi:hypothetical protein